MSQFFNNDFIEILAASIPVFNLLPATENIRTGREEFDKRIGEISNRIIDSGPRIEIISEVRKLERIDKYSEIESKWKVIRGICKLIPLLGILGYSIAAACLKEKDPIIEQTEKLADRNMESLKSHTSE